MTVFILFSYLVLKEKLNWYTAAGFVLIFTGVRIAPRRLLQFVARKLMGSRPPPVRDPKDQDV